MRKDQTRTGTARALEEDGMSNKTCFGSGSADQRISGGWCSHGGAEARREQREESTTRPRGQLVCPVLLPVMLEPPRGCPQAFQHVPRSSILCGCINKFLYRQANAVWGRYPTACTYARGSRGVLVGLVTLGLFVHPSDQSAAIVQYRPRRRACRRMGIRTSSQRKSWQTQRA
jgi:hypothetical protein